MQDVSDKFAHRLASLVIATEISFERFETPKCLLVSGSSYSGVFFLLKSNFYSLKGAMGTKVFTVFFNFLVNLCVRLVIPAGCSVTSNI